MSSPNDSDGAMRCSECGRACTDQDSSEVVPIDWSRSSPQLARTICCDCLLEDAGEEVSR